MTGSQSVQYKEINQDSNSKSGPPLVSVCCTTYNLEKCIETTLQGFLSQKTDFNFEIIIHDDASSDKTPEILTKHQHLYPQLIKLILQEKNQHGEQNISLGEIYRSYLLPAASGQYIATCDGDDFWTDSAKLQTQVQLMQSNASLSCCFTNAVIQNELNQSQTPYLSADPGNVLPEEKALYAGGGLYPSSSLMFRKESLLSSELYRNMDNFTRLIEWDTWFIIALNSTGKIGYIHRPMTVYRRWEAGKYSSITGDRSLLAERSAGQITGLQKLRGLLPARQKRFLKRKISIESLYYIRHGSGRSRFTYLKNLHTKEWIKLISGL